MDPFHGVKDSGHQVNLRLIIHDLSLNSLNSSPFNGDTTFTVFGAENHCFLGFTLFLGSVAEIAKEPRAIANGNCQ